MGQYLAEAALCEGCGRPQQQRPWPITALPPRQAHARSSVTLGFAGDSAQAGDRAGERAGPGGGLRPQGPSHPPFHSPGKALGVRVVDECVKVRAVTSQGAEGAAKPSPSFQVSGSSWDPGGTGATQGLGPWSSTDSSFRKVPSAGRMDGPGLGMGGDTRSRRG